MMEYLKDPVMWIICLMVVFIIYITDTIWDAFGIGGGW